MTRYIRIQHEYVLEVPSEISTEELPLVVNAGVSEFDEWITGKVGNIIPNTLKSDYQWMPHSYHPPPKGKRIDFSKVTDAPIVDPSVVGPEEGQVTFIDAEQVGGIAHPWDQGLWIFPTDHPMHEAEAAARAQYGQMSTMNHAYADGLKEGFTEEAQKVLELEAGEDDSSS